MKKKDSKIFSKRSQLVHMFLDESGECSSGHMYEKDIERLVSEINPKVTIPIHTEHLELFTQWGDT